MDEPDDLPEVEDDDLAPTSRTTQRPPDETPAELSLLHVGHVGPEDGGPKDLAPHRERGYVLRDDGDFGQLWHLRSSKKGLDVAGDTVLVHAWHDPVRGLADLAGHPPDRDPVPGEAEHIDVVVGIAKGQDTLGRYPPPPAQELEGRRLRAFQATDLDIVRQAACNEEASGEGRLRLLEPTRYIVGVVHDDELRRFFTAAPEPIRRGVHDGDAGLGVPPQVLERRGCVRGGDDAPVEEDAGM